MNLFINEKNVGSIPSKLKAGIIAFNQPFLGEWKDEEFSIHIEDDDKNLIGGISGYYAKTYMIVQWVWVDKNYRQQGIGKKLILKLEELAKEKHCNFIQLETMDFQAKDFYEKLGFSLIATLPDWFEGYALHIMRKRL